PWWRDEVSHPTRVPRIRTTIPSTLASSVPIVKRAGLGRVSNTTRSEFARNKTIVVVKKLLNRQAPGRRYVLLGTPCVHAKGDLGGRIGRHAGYLDPRS